MSLPAGMRLCSVCDRNADSVHRLAGVGEICDDCLLAGSFLGGSSTVRLEQAANRMIELSGKARSLIAQAVYEAEKLARDDRIGEAREQFIRQAEGFSEAGQFLLEAALLFRALRLPGQSVLVYERLGLVAMKLGCERQAVQYLKTASWLALKSDDRALLERILERLERLVPEDQWISRARRRHAAASSDSPCCRVCGMPLEENEAEAHSSGICPDCRKRTERF